MRYDLEDSLNEGRAKGMMSATRPEELDKKSLNDGNSYEWYLSRLWNAWNNYSGRLLKTNYYLTIMKKPRIRREFSIEQEKERSREHIMYSEG